MTSLRPPPLSMRMKSQVNHTLDLQSGGVGWILINFTFYYIIGVHTFHPQLLKRIFDHLVRASQTLLPGQPLDLRLPKNRYIVR